MPRYCSQYGNNGHISRTYAGDSGAGTGTGEIMLFGVRVTVDPMRKSVSMSNLSQYEQPHETSNKDKADVPAGDAYASADDAVQHSFGSRERKRGVPWSEEEHKLFLIGLQKVGKGDWRGISRSFVTTRTPTQVASHAQKYFLRRHNYNRRRRRSSLFDITSESISAMATEEQVKPQDNKSQPYLPRLDTCNTGGFSLVPSNPIPAIPVPVRTSPVPIHMLIENPTQDLTQGLASQVNHQSMNLIRPIPFLAVPPDLSTDLDLDIRSTVDPSSLSLKLSLSLDHSSRQYAFQAMPNFNEGDGIISVA